MHDLLFRPSREEYLQALGQGYNLVNVFTELMADCETPIAAFQKLLDDEETAGHDGYAFLLESAEKSDQVGRYSFLGGRPAALFESTGREVTLTLADSPPLAFRTEGDPLAELQRFLSRYRPAPTIEDQPPPFAGGAVGFLGYDVVRFFEPSVPVAAADQLRLPETCFLITDTLLTFDHRYRRLRLAANVFVGEETDAAAAYDQAQAKLTRLARRLRAPGTLRPVQEFRPLSAPDAFAATSNTTPDEYEAMVARGLEHIRAGDIFQFVPSQRFELPYAGDALSLYRALRYVNPSPYMFLVKFGRRFSLVGSSPELHVRVRDRRVELRPIAGTAPRGRTPAEDQALTAALLADPKERAEHLMLVDLGRNDVGRVSEFGSVRVSDLMTIEKYSHVQHIVSHVEGRLRADRDAFDAMRATFPAGTLTGAPKVRAMQIIAALEKSKRGCYGGAMGYFGFDGNLDSCITLRSVVLQDGRAYVQTGGGVVADSTPAGEYAESVNKARGMVRAVELARQFAD